MAKALTLRAVAKWLTANGFHELPGRQTSHRQFSNGRHKITLKGHGPPDLSKKQVGMLVRQIAAAGFDRETVRRELQ